MIWPTWRQFRTQIITAAAALAALAGALFWTHSALARLYATSGVLNCDANTNCATLVTRFLDELPRIAPLLYFLCIGFMFAVPAIIGVFWEAPLIAREIEAHTSSWPETRALPALAGWRSSSPSPDWRPWPPPGCSASW
jgi:hypothetical protein